MSSLTAGGSDWLLDLTEVPSRTSAQKAARAAGVARVTRSCSATGSGDGAGGEVLTQGAAGGEVATVTDTSTDAAADAAPTSVVVTVVVAAVAAAFSVASGSSAPLTLALKKAVIRCLLLP